MSIFVRFATIEIFVSLNHLRLLVNQLTAWGMHTVEKACLNFELCACQ